MRTKKENEIFNENIHEYDVFSFSEKENQKQFLNENYVFGDENNANQVSKILNTQQSGVEENDNYNSSFKKGTKKEEYFEETAKNAKLNNDAASISSSAASTSTAAVASSSASVVATVATVATTAVVLVVGVGVVSSEYIDRPRVCFFNQVVSVENTIAFELALGNDEEKIISGEENDECSVTVELTRPDDNSYYAEYKINNYGISNGVFNDLEYGTEYSLNVAQNKVLGAEKDYLLEEPYLITTHEKGFIPVINVTGVSLSPKELSLEVNQEATLIATVSPSDATNREVTWTSNNTDVATVDQDGKVIAIGEGETTIVVETADGGFKDTCSVTVTEPDIPVTSISFDYETLEMDPGDSLTLNVTIEPENATDKSLAWSSSDENIVDVDDNGKITAISSGTATIQAYSNSGQVTATCTVTVKEIIVPVTKITVSPDTLTLVVGDSENLSATVEPENATDKSVKWTSGDESVATVDDSGLVTAVAAGGCTIYASTLDGGISGSCTVTVNNPTYPTTSVQLSENEISIEENTSHTLEVTILPENTTDTASWSSNDESVAKVDQSGNVTAVAPGTAIITVTSGEYSDTCYVTVTQAVVPADSIVITDMQSNPLSSIGLAVGETQQVSCTISPETATDNTVTWSYTGERVFEITEEGTNSCTITAIAAGTATLVATSNSDPDVYGECVVTVNAAVVPVESVTVDPEEVSVDVGDTTTLTATIEPENATDQSITWESGDTSIATVNEQGVVTGVAVGDCTIYAYSSNREIYGTCQVFVDEPIIPVTNIVIDPDTLTLETDDVRELSATVEPETATDQSITWQSSNQEVATVNEQGVVTAIGEGTCEIYAYSSDGDVHGTCSVTVNEPHIAITSISIDPGEISLEVGDTQELTVTIEPEDATDQSVTWSSNNEEVATVDENGLVTAIGVGEAEITVTATDGGETATCFVSVSQTEQGTFNSITFSYYRNPNTAYSNIIPVISFDYSDPDEVWDKEFSIEFESAAAGPISGRLIPHPFGSLSDTGSYYIEFDSDEDAESVVNNPDNYTYTIIATSYHPHDESGSHTVCSEQQLSGWSRYTSNIDGTPNYILMANDTTYSSENPTYDLYVKIEESSYLQEFDSVEVVVNGSTAMEITPGLDSNTGAVVDPDEAATIVVYGLSGENRVLIYKENVSRFQIN